MAATSGTNWQRPIFIAGSVVLVVAALYLARAVLIPVVFAMLLTLVLSPAVSALQHRGLGRVPSVIAVVFLAFCLLGALGFGVAVQLKNLATDLPQHKHQIEAKIERIREARKGSWLDNAYETFTDISRKIRGTEAITGEATGQEPIPVVIESSPFPLVQSALGPTIEVLLAAGMTLVLLIFMLIQREDLRNRMIRLWGNTRMASMTKAVDEAIRRISRFLLVQLAINAAFGTALAIGLSLLGVPYAILCGFFSGTLRYVPYIGTWIGALLPITLSIAIQPGWTQPLLVLGLFLFLELMTYNFIEPWLFAQTIGVSATALLIAAAFWAWLWGPIGLVISTPLTACLAVLGRYVPNLEFFGILLGDEPVLEPYLGYYQRLLAKDRDEAMEIVEEFIQTHSEEEVYDQVLMPALVLERTNREHGQSSAQEQQFVLEVTREVLEEVLATPDRAASQDANTREDGRVLVLGCPARDETDELALWMFGQMVDSNKCRFEVVSHNTLAAEIVSQVQQQQVAAICIASVPPKGLAHARYLCKRLRARFPDLKILVGCWGQEDNFERTRNRLLEASADKVGRSLLETRDQLMPLIQLQSHIQHQEEGLQVV